MGDLRKKNDEKIKGQKEKEKEREKSLAKKRQLVMKFF